MQIVPEVNFLNLARVGLTKNIPGSIDKWMWCNAERLKTTFGCRFDPDAVRVVLYAEQAAVKRRQPEITTGHLVAGCLNDIRIGIAFRQLGIIEKDLLQAVGGIIGDNYPDVSKQPPLSYLAKEILSSSAFRAMQTNRNVMPRDILSSVVRRWYGIGSLSLEGCLGVTEADTNKILAGLDRPQSSTTLTV